MSFDKSGMDSYVDVATRISEFRDKHPDGSLQPTNPLEPYRILTIGDDTYVVVIASAYRHPDDSCPGIGMAYEQYPGRTPYTRGSELQNAETSAWGRAIVAALAADTRRGVATADEVRNRRADREQDELDREQARQNWIRNCRTAVAAAGDRDALVDIQRRISEAHERGLLTVQDTVDLRREVVARLDADFTASQIQETTS